MKKLLTMIFLFLASTAITGCSGSERNEACIYAEEDVKAQLISPYTAVFPTCSDRDIEEYEPHKFAIESYVDSQNRFGTMIRSEYLCEVHLSTDEPSVTCLVL